MSKADVLQNIPTRAWASIQSHASILGIRRKQPPRAPTVRRKAKTSLLGDLRAARISAGLTQKELARIVGFPDQARTCAYENGKGISVFVLKAWCEALGLELRAVPAPGGKVKNLPAKRVPALRPKTMAEQAAIDMARWRIEQALQDSTDRERKVA